MGEKLNDYQIERQDTRVIALMVMTRLPHGESDIEVIKMSLEMIIFVVL